MARQQRTTYRNNIVIVCEGSETEATYFRQIQNYIETNFPARFDEIKVVPPKDKNKLHPNTSREERATHTPKITPYYELTDYTQTDYNNYCSQPVRYVREARLFMEMQGYVEAWAVYDLDTFTKHEEARGLAEQWGVKIAFSSISFEEWILLHFEQNTTPFVKSACKVQVQQPNRRRPEKKDNLCAHRECIDQTQNCNGSTCISGLLRSAGHLPEYAKNDESLHDTILPLFPRAIINSAWIKSLQPQLNIWERNPYSDVIHLIGQLYDVFVDYKWLTQTDAGGSDEFNGLTINRTDIKNNTNSNIIVHIIGCDSNLIELNRVHIFIAPQETKPYTTDPNATYIVIENGDREKGIYQL